MPVEMKGRNLGTSGPREVREKPHPSTMGAMRSITVESCAKHAVSPSQERPSQGQGVGSQVRLGARARLRRDISLWQDIPELATIMAERMAEVLRQGP
jgi:hypothetical protein